MTKSTVINESTADSSDSVGGPALLMDEVTIYINLNQQDNFKSNILFCGQIETPSHSADKNRNQEDIMSVLMELEKPTTKATVDSSDDEAAARSLLEQITPAAAVNQPHVVEYSKKFIRPKFKVCLLFILISPSLSLSKGDVEMMDSDSDEEIPKVKVGDLEFPVNEVPEEQVERMTPSEKDAYVQLHQEYMERLGFLD